MKQVPWQFREGRPGGDHKLAKGSRWTEQPGSVEDPASSKAGKLELMELENIVANTVYLKAREGNHNRSLLFRFRGHPAIFRDKKVAGSFWGFDWRAARQS